MYLDAGAVERHCLDPDSHDLLALELFEHLVEHPGLRPPTHAGVDRVPIAESLGQAPPLASVLCDVQHGIDDLQIAHAYVASLQGQAVLDARKLIACDLHAAQCQALWQPLQLVLTGPSREGLVSAPRPTRRDAATFLHDVSAPH